MIPNIFNFAANNYLYMIQRIQTLYLFIADLLVAILFFVPFAEISGKEGSLYRFDVLGVICEGATGGAIMQLSWPVLLLACLILILLNLTIFQFKKRVRQMKLSYFTIFLLIGLTALIYFYVWKSSSLMGGSYSLTIFFIFPLIASVFVYLAIRGIAKDELLVKSIDRIR